MAKKENVIAVLTMLEEIYPHRKELSDTTIEIYCELFKGVPDELIAGAAKQHVAQAKFFPSPAEILEIARKLANWDGKAPPAILAWGEVQEKMYSPYCDEGVEMRSKKPTGNQEEDEQAIGDYISHFRGCDVCSGSKPPEFTHELIRKTVEALGWKELRQSDNTVADRAHFIKAYEALTAREKEGEVLLPEIKQLASDMSAKQLESG